MHWFESNLPSHIVECNHFWLHFYLSIKYIYIISLSNFIYGGTKLVKIRLTRLGKHKNPFYRIVAVDSRRKRDGSYLALVGTYEPFSGKVILKTDIILDLLSKGAVPSETVANLFKQKGVLQQFAQTQKKPAKKAKKARKTKTNSKTKKTDKVEEIKK
ncbi:MAG: 30S ribosomal protein S16 [Mycoplasma sp.]|nr:30S ribosomal protein S16 [Mycoplasma sp.]